MNSTASEHCFKVTLHILLVHMVKILYWDLFLPIYIGNRMGDGSKAWLNSLLLQMMVIEDYEERGKLPIIGLAMIRLTPIHSRTHEKAMGRRVSPTISHTTVDCKPCIKPAD